MEKKYNYYWGFGIEHETHFVKLTRNQNMKSYDIIDLEGLLFKLLDEWDTLKNDKNIKKFYKMKNLFTDENYKLFEEIIFRKFESTGRKCNGKYVLKPLHNKNMKVIKMPEFVTTQPFSRTKKKKIN